MSFQKIITNPRSGVQASYIRLSTIWLDFPAQELSVQFQIFADAQTAAQPDAEPALPQVIKLRLTGADFSAVCGRAKIAERAQAGADILQMLYEAARNHPLISDWGSAPLADAADV